MTKDEWKQRFAQNMRVARARLGIRQSDAATRMRVFTQQFQRWEAGQQVPTAYTIQRLSEALECEVSDLMP
jgi:transcriptional regulator with XRE-family HTH domain